MKACWPVLIALLLAACSPRIFVQQAPGSSLPGAATYAWEPASADALPGQQDPHVSNEITQSLLQAALAQGLSRRGYRPDNSGHAAWLASISSGLQRTTEVYEEPAMQTSDVVCGIQGCFLVPWAASYTRDSIQVDEHTIMVDLRDAQTRKLVWRGMITRRVDLPRDFTAGRLQEAVNTLLEKLPGTIANQ